MKKILSITLSIMISMITYSQCVITPFTAIDTLNCGDSLIVDFTVYADLVLTEAFTNGGPQDTNWVSTSGAIYTNPYTPSPSNDPYFWMGTSPIVPTALVSSGFDVSGGGQVCFDFAYAVQGQPAPTEGPDLYNEGISLQYSIDGGLTWIDMVYYAPNGDTLPSNPGVTAPNVSAGTTNFNAWTSVCIDIPPGAMTTNTSFQWIQEVHSSPNNDHWGLDNIVIATADPTYSIYYLNNNDNLGPAPVTHTTYITTDTTYTYMYTAGGTDTCYGNLNAYMNQTYLGPDVVLDCNTNIVQLAAAGVSLNDNYSWTPTSFLSNPNSLNPTASPIDTTEYIFNSSCGSDTIMVNVVANYLFSTSNDTVICVGDSAFLNVYGGAQNFSWTPNNGTISDATIANPVVKPLNTTTYTVSADSAGCIKTHSFTVTVSNKNFFIVLPTGAGCSGASSGSVLAVANGSIGQHTYILDDGVDTTMSISPQFNGLAAGDYIVTYTDSLNCPVDTAVTIDGGISISIDSITLVNPLCVGDTNGSIEVFVDTNVVVNYSINNGLVQTSPIFTGLTNGSYLVSAQVGNCPADTQTVILSAPATVAISFLDSTDLSCGGAGDGEIQVSATNGVMPFQYSIDNINFFNNGGVIDSLAAGNYTVFVIDANGCRDSLTTSITEPTPVTVTNVIAVNPLCFNDSTGSILFDAVGGTMPYVYSIDSGLNFITTNNFPSLWDDSYMLMAQDVNGCLSLVVPDTLVNPAQLILVEDSTQSSSCGSADGIIYVSGSGGGTTSLLFNIDGGAFQASGVFAGESAGIHTIILQDAAGCSETIDVLVTDNGAPTLSIVSATSVSCNGLDDAMVQLSATGGITPYLFSVNGSPLDPDSLFLNLGGGLHNFIVEDSIGCIGAVDTVIFEPTLLDVTATQDSVNCFGGVDGNITLFASGGLAPYIYALDDTSIVQTMPTFNNYAIGSYMGYVMDMNGCIDSVMQEVLEPDTLEITTNAVDISCSAAGSITVSSTGGVMPYSYTLNTGAPQTSNVFTITTGGTYFVSVVDANGCGPATATDVILAPSAVLYTVDSITSSLLCAGDTDGFIGVAASGGSGPYTYSLNGGAFQTDSFFNNLSAGMYTVNVQDMFGCLSILTTHVIATPSVVINTISTTTVSCFGLADGTIIIDNVFGGVGPYDIVVGGITYPYSSGLIIGNLSAGNYTVLIVDANGCGSTELVTILDVTPFNLTLGAVSNASCYGVLDGEIEISATGGTPIYTFELFTAASSTTISNNSSAVFTGLAGAETGTVYPILVTDANGCTDSLSHTITQPNALIIDSLSASPESCFGYYDGLIATHVSGGSSPYTYSWAPTGYANVIADGLTSGVHTVTVTDANGCSVSASETLPSISPVLADVTPDSASISMGDTLQLGVNVQNAIGTNLQYSWSPTTALSCTDCENPVVTVYNDISYSVVVTDENGCMSYNQTEVYIAVDNSLFFFIPNGFTPNGDGINDNFQVYGQDVKSVDMMVFNRWGEKVFEGANQFQPWDGTYKGSPQAPGAFTYVIDVTFLNDAEVQKKGSVSLIR